MRSNWKFNFFDKHIFRLFTKSKENIENINIRSRRSVVPFNLFEINENEIDQEIKLQVYFGALTAFKYNTKISLMSISHTVFTNKNFFFKFGEFVLSKRRSKLIHAFNSIYQKNMKKKKLFFLKKKRRMKTISKKNK